MGHYRNILISTIYLILALTLAFTLPACHRNNNVEANLEFSSDTVMFDTVFTTVTSSTRTFTVRNTTGSPVEVDIILAGGKQSYYSINVDGVAGTEFRNVEIPAHDSIFVFVKVNINPADQNLPTRESLLIICSAILPAQRVRITITAMLPRV